MMKTIGFSAGFGSLLAFALVLVLQPSTTGDALANGPSAEQIQAAVDHAEAVASANGARR